MNSKRIGLVLSNVPEYSETFLINKIKGLQQNGFEVVLFVNENPPKPSKFLCEVHVAPSFNTSLVRTLLNIVSTIIKACFVNPRQSFRLYNLDKKDGLPFKTRIKQVLVNQFLLSQNLDWLHFGFGMLAVNRENVAQAIGAKMAVSFRGFDLYLSPLKHKNCYHKLFTKKVKYHVLSQGMKRNLMSYSIPENNIKVITPAIDVGFFDYNPKPFKTDFVNITTVARLHWIKGLEYTLEALFYLKKEGYKFHYTVVGDGSEFERLIFAAHQLDIRDQVTFKGKLSHDQVKEQLKTSQIYLQYSIQEGFCNAVLEAQAMGLMCIVSNAEGLSENVLHAKTGWVVPKRNPLALKDSIKSVIQMLEKDKDKIRSNAVDRIKNKFHISKQQKEFIDFYKTS